jgi:tRNA-specific 2-thiouridylase
MGLRAERVCWVAGGPPPGPIDVQVKLRHRATPAEARLLPGPDWAQISFEQPQRAVSRGQAAVFYNGVVVLGGGTIEDTWPLQPCCNPDEI